MSSYPRLAIKSGHPPSSRAVRVSAALQGFLGGDLSLAEAVRLSGGTTAEFIDLVAASEGPGNAPSTSEGPGGVPRLSVVVPVYNEEDNVAVLHARLLAALRDLGSFEIVFVDDGSTDNSADLICQLQRRDPAVRLVRFSRNFGHQAALSAGIDYARGDAVVIMDADLQDPPELLPELVRAWEGGAEVVYAFRRKRQEGIFKRATAAGFYRLLRIVANVEIPVDSGDFCLLDRKVADVLRSLPERNRFIRGLRSWAGFSQVGVPYDRPARHAGETKFTLRKMTRLASDGVMSFTSLPLRIASWIGFATVAAGFAYLALAVATQLTSGSLPQGWTSLVAIVLILGGAQLVVLGVLGSYVARVYDETKHRPLYVVSRLHEAQWVSPEQSG